MRGPQQLLRDRTIKTTKDMNFLNTGPQNNKDR